MWSPDRRNLLALLAAGVAGGGLVGCGFSPAYGPAGPAQGLRDRIKADPPASRNDFDFVSAFENAMGRSADPAWRMAYQISVFTTGLAVTPEGSTLRYNYVGNVNFQVRDAISGEVVTQGAANSFTASAATRSTIAAAASSTDATARLMQILSDLVVTQLLATSSQWVTPTP